jgi:MerR family transcriptional regulator, mercuric resistance operon regulatory protein
MREYSPGVRYGIGALSKDAAVNIETIRYYERVGIMPKPLRTEGGHRVYDVDQLKRLVFIRRTRELGFSLDEIRALLELVDGGDYTCAEVQGMTLAHADNIRKKIADLRRMERVLKDMAAQCDGGDVPECPIVDALSL